MALQYTNKEKRNIIIRIILIAILIVVIGVCIVMAVNSMKPKVGINTIEADYLEHTEASSNYQLNYYLDNDNGTNVSEKKLVISNLYSKALDEIYPLVDLNSYDGINNIYYINNHPNEEIKINKSLYNYLKKIYDFDKNYILKGNALRFWESLCYSSSINQKSSDPFINDEINNEINKFNNNYINNIDVLFLENDYIKLVVKDDYYKIIDEDVYIYLSYLNDAIIMDYVKNYLNSNNYYNGYIVSNCGLVLDLGNEANQNTFSMLAFEKIAYEFDKLKIEKNHSYVNLYNMNVSNLYPFYQIEKDNQIIKRTIFTDVSSLNSTFDFDNLIYCGEDDMLTTLLKSLSFAYNDEYKSNIHYKIKDKTIITNDASYSCDGFEVSYEI